MSIPDADIHNIFDDMINNINKMAKIISFEMYQAILDNDLEIIEED